MHTLEMIETGIVIARGMIVRWGKGKVTLFSPEWGYTTYDTIGVIVR